MPLVTIRQLTAERIKRHALPGSTYGKPIPATRSGYVRIYLDKEVLAKLLAIDPNADAAINKFFNAIEAEAKNGKTS